MLSPRLTDPSIPAPATDSQKFLSLISDSWEEEFDWYLAQALSLLSLKILESSCLLFLFSYAI